MIPKCKQPSDPKSTSGQIKVTAYIGSKKVTMSYYMNRKVIACGVRCVRFERRACGSREPGGDDLSVIMERVGNVACWARNKP